MMKVEDKTRGFREGQTTSDTLATLVDNSFLFEFVSTVIVFSVEAYLTPAIQAIGFAFAVVEVNGWFVGLTFGTEFSVHTL